MSLLLEIVEGPGAGTTVPLEGPLVLGRGTQSDVVLDDERASRRHAEVRPDGPRAVVHDLGSANGTLVDGRPLFGETFLTPGQQVQIGVTVLQLRAEEELRDRPTAAIAVPDAFRLPSKRPTYVPDDVAITPAAAPDDRRMTAPAHELDRFLDVRVKAGARVAPVAILVLVAVAVVLFLGLSST
ncbi:MAG: FHA domain-containing protein [Solirubrobacteraceae bacterium]|nr:FHA domain-containing protein [Solirubrobacteraceae bacterium]